MTVARVVEGEGGARGPAGVSKTSTSTRVREGGREAKVPGTDPFGRRNGARGDGGRLGGSENRDVEQKEWRQHSCHHRNVRVYRRHRGHHHGYEH